MVPLLIALLNACNSSSEETTETPQAKATPKEPDPEGEAYSLKINSTELKLVFNDTNQNNVFDEGTDQLFLKEKSSFVNYGTDAYDKLATKYSLPDFSGLEVNFWFADRTHLMGETSTLKASRMFEEIRKYCDGRIDIHEAMEIASHIQTNTELEKLQALTIVITVLELQNGSRQVFYSESPEKKLFIDQVIQIIQEGKIKLNISSNSSANLKFFMAGYIFNTNTFSLKQKHLINIEDFSHRALVIHELFHLYQDYQKLNMTIEESEMEAYAIEAEYIYDTELLPRQCTSENIDDILSKDLKIDPTLKDIITHISKYIVHKKIGNDELAKQSQNEITKFIHRSGYINGIMEEDKYVISQMAGNLVLDNPDKTAEDLLPAVKEMYSELAQFHQAHAEKKVSLDEMPALRSVYGTYIVSGVLYLQARDLYAQQKESPQTFGSSGPIIPRQHVNQEIDEFLESVALFRPLSIVERPYDGIE